MSETLKSIMKHWTDDIATAGTVDLPFNIEQFCRENDKRLTAYRMELEWVKYLLLDFSERYGDGPYHIPDEAKEAHARIEKFLKGVSE